MKSKAVSTVKVMRSSPAQYYAKSESRKNDLRVGDARLLQRTGQSLRNQSPSSDVWSIHSNSLYSPDFSIMKDMLDPLMSIPKSDVYSLSLANKTVLKSKRPFQMLYNSLSREKSIIRGNIQSRSIRNALSREMEVF